ncbi:MAG TPA: RidA family protein [Ignavibacteria bacterium]|nr:RidA family protein [Ignavibacteria bacterium]HQY51598.1 RidA family protein [Ignavibacteria bacterium]HRA99591.1 RidA family protein [Ignavibacteria bacterium]
MKSILISDKAAPPVGPYSQAVGIGDLIYTSGQIPFDVDGNLVSDNIEGQTEKVLENLKSILEDNGSSLDNAVKTMVFLNDMNNFAKMNEVYSKYFVNSPPARSTVEVSRLPKDVLVEIEIIAFKNK